VPSLPLSVSSSPRRSDDRARVLDAIYSNVRPSSHTTQSSPSTIAMSSVTVTVTGAAALSAQSARLSHSNTAAAAAAAAAHRHSANTNLPHRPVPPSTSAPIPPTRLPVPPSATTTTTVTIVPSTIVGLAARRALRRATDSALSSTSPNNATQKGSTASDVGGIGNDGADIKSVSTQKRMRFHQSSNLVPLLSLPSSADNNDTSMIDGGRSPNARALPLTNSARDPLDSPVSSNIVHNHDTLRNNNKNDEVNDSSSGNDMNASTRSKSIKNRSDSILEARREAAFHQRQLKLAQRVHLIESEQQRRALVNIRLTMYLSFSSPLLTMTSHDMNMII
jgi:hypothetical protein